MCEQEKCDLLNELCSPMGYRYDCCQEVFTSGLDGWQKQFGYTYSYDRFAPFFNMVFDTLPVYFDYAGRTWLIELWKGQYGITTGAEVGVYHADGLVEKKDYKTALFHAVGKEEFLNISLALGKNGETLACFHSPHWWQTAFCVGSFSHPQELCLHVTLTFRSCDMLAAFVASMLRLGYSSRNMSACGHRLTFSFSSPFKDCCGFFCRLNRSFALWRCRLLCRLYLWLVRPVRGTTDQLLYLYFYLPSFFCRSLRLYAANHRYRKQHKKIFRRQCRHLNKR